MGLTAASHVTLATFAVVVCFVVHPLRVLRRNSDTAPWWAEVGPGTAPVLGAAILAIAGTLPFGSVVDGVMGTGRLRPIEMLQNPLFDEEYVSLQLFLETLNVKDAVEKDRFFTPNPIPNPQP